jgi:hypothetical protein
MSQKGKLLDRNSGLVVYMNTEFVYLAMLTGIVNTSLLSSLKLVGISIINDGYSHPSSAHCVQSLPLPYNFATSSTAFPKFFPSNRPKSPSGLLSMPTVTLCSALKDPS